MTDGELQEVAKCLRKIGFHYDSRYEAWIERWEIEPVYTVIEDQVRKQIAAEPPEPTDAQLQEVAEAIAKCEGMTWATLEDRQCARKIWPIIARQLRSGK